MNNKIEYDGNGKPHLKLSPLDKTAIRILDVKEHDTFMQICEAGGLVDEIGYSPTEKGYQKGYLGYDGCEFMEFKRKLPYSYKRLDDFFGYTILHLNNFLDSQKISLETIQELGEYFDLKRSFRRSKS